MGGGASLRRVPAAARSSHPAPVTTPPVAGSSGRATGSRGEGADHHQDLRRGPAALEPEQGTQAIRPRDGQDPLRARQVRRLRRVSTMIGGGTPAISPRHGQDLARVLGYVEE